ncbi:MAG: TonB-dependent receptor [Pseudomonadota bacterium]
MGASVLAGANAYAQGLDGENIDRIIVVGDPVGLLDDGPTESVFGFGLSGLETPRSVSVVSDETMQRYAIEDIDDFITTTPGTFGGSFFGVPGSITIRGAISETYFRGFKRALNNGLFPTPIGSAERVEIVRGAPPVIYGAGRVGGFLNFMPKAARNEGQSADGPSGSLAVTGGSYEKFNLRGDVAIPFELGGKEGGLALYAEYEDSGSFYRGRTPEHELLQADFKQDLGGDWSVQIGGMYFNTRGYFQSPGWNRLTQDLIDNGAYVTGVDTDIADVNGDGQLNPAEIDAVVGTFFGASNIRTLVDFGVFGFPDAYALDSGVGVTTLDRRDVFLSDREIADSETLTLYGDIVREFDNGSAKLQLFYDSVDGALNVTYGFAAEHVMDVFEVRGSVTRAFEVSDLVKVDVHATASYRRYESELREQFLSGYLVLDRRDLSRGATATDIFATPLTDPTIPWDSDFSSLWTDTGAGLVADIQIENLSILVGGRYDHYDVEASNAGVTTFGAPTEGEATEGDFSYSASVSYRSDIGIVPYFTYAEGSEPLYNANGGISPAAAAAEQVLFDSELLEAGVKFSLVNARINGSVAYYDQSRTLVDPFGNVDREASEGVEIELRILASDNVTFTGAATFQEFNIAAPGACGSGNGEFVVIAPNHPSVNAFGQTITGAQGYGGLFSALNASCLPELQGGYQRTVIPDRVFSAFATYTSDETPSGFSYGGTLGATFVSETGGKTTTAVTLPAYALVRAGLFATYGRFNLTGTLENALDKDYFQPVQGVYEEVAALPGKGRVARITATVSF